jgi:hypothetical protein
VRRGKAAGGTLANEGEAGGGGGAAARQSACMHLSQSTACSSLWGPWEHDDFMPWHRPLPTSCCSLLLLPLLLAGRWLMQRPQQLQHMNHCQAAATRSPTKASCHQHPQGIEAPRGCCLAPGDLRWRTRGGQSGASTPAPSVLGGS